MHAATTALRVLRCARRTPSTCERSLAPLVGCPLGHFCHCNYLATAVSTNSARPHPIEVESYQIMESRVDLSAWPAPARSVVARMIHATADESFASSVLIGPKAVPRAVEALQATATVICDSRMVAAGIPAVAALTRVICALDYAASTTTSMGAPQGETLSAAGISGVAQAHPLGAIWVIGNAPTALARLVELYRLGLVEPAAVIGLPVGYVGAARSKADLWESPLREMSITNRGERGGSPVAAAALNALSRLRPA